MSTNTSISSSDSALDNKLSGLIASLIGQKARIDTDVPGLSLHRWTEPTDPTSYMLAPSICLIGQGRKRLFLGEETFIYDAEHFLITSVELPVVTQIIEASPEKPYLGLTMELDLRLISQLMIDNQITPDKKQTDRCGIGVSRVPGNLNDAFCRLLSLASQPEDIVPLAPLIRQEIFYRLLKSDQGPRLRAITSNANHGYQIAVHGTSRYRIPRITRCLKTAWESCDTS